MPTLPEEDAQRVAPIAALDLQGADLAAYRALDSAAVCFESTDRWISFRGDKAVDALNGLVTNDVSTLRIGDGLYAAALTPKGKVISDLHIFRVDMSALLLLVPLASVDGWLGVARKYVNPRLAKVADDTDRYAAWRLYGAGALEVLSAWTPATSDADVTPTEPLASWPTWHHHMGSIASTPLRIVRAPNTGDTPGVILLAAASDAGAVRELLSKRMVQLGSQQLWDVLRVECGRPAWGAEMDENTIPQEANLDLFDAISFNKGCYTGQETVARLHFRGHVNRQLRGLRANTPMTRGATVLDANGKEVGDVRSAVISPRLGSIAIAMIRREVAVGDPVQLVLDGVFTPARVVELPFADQ